MRALATSRLVRAVDPWLVLVVLVGAWARFSRVGEFDNQYYTATVASMLHGAHNFLFGSFDPGGVVTADKPPGAFWVQAASAYVFGVSAWSVSLPQAVAGVLAPIVVYAAVRVDYGRIAARAAAAVLVVMPAGIVIDSRNEPDGLLYFALLLAAVCIIRAAKTGGWRWLLLFSLAMGAAFNIKMLAAFVPLPAFLLYYALSARSAARQTAIRVAVATLALLVVSFSWVTLVALTPAASRPFVGSTRDNSIWTLVFEYNGFNRFTSFAAPRLAQPRSGQPAASAPSPDAQQGPARPTARPPQAAGASQGAQPIASNAVDQGVLGLFNNPLAAQMGWLFPVAALMLVVSVLTLLSEPLYRRPLELPGMLRSSPASAQTVLWAGWLVTAAVVFGAANATTTHPYYLVGMAVPVAAVTGIGFGALWRTVREGTPLSWTAPAALLGGAVYQALLSQGQVSDLVVSVVLVAVLLACIVVASALWRKLADTPLARGAVATGAVALLVVPLVFGLGFGGRIAQVRPGQQPPPLAAAGAPAGAQGGQRARAIVAYVRRTGAAEARFAVGVVSGQEAAPFIVAGVPAVAIGGFGGGDPIFTVASFRQMAERGELRYFLMPREGAIVGPPVSRSQDPILDDIRATWRDVSREAGLPQGSLWAYQPGN